MRSRAVLSLLAVLAASVTVLSGCSAVQADPMGNSLRAFIRLDRADRAWATVAGEYPEALRPRATAGPVLDESVWTASTRACYTDEGFIVVRRGSTFEYGSSQGQLPVQFAVAEYLCGVSVPSVPEIAAYLNASQRGALYDYYLDRVQPCLALSGASVGSAPSRTKFDSASGATLWSPYLAVTQAKTGSRRLAALQRACPPTPAWLHL